MAEITKASEQELEGVAGGLNMNGWATVCNLKTGYLALRTKPGYDYANEIRGSESFNGDTLQITGGYAVGPDGKTYVYVFNPRSNRSGWVNAAFLR